MSKLIKNGHIINANSEFDGDIYIEGEKIVAVGKNLDYKADEIVEAKGMYVFPGGVDMHTHYALPYGKTISRGFETSQAAPVGGTTTVVDFAPQQAGKSILDGVLQHKEKQGAMASVDYALHALIMDTNPDTLDQLYNDIEKLPEIGVATLKMFMVYKGTVLHCRDEVVYKALLASKKAGVTPFVHAESADIVEEMRQDFIKQGKTELKYHLLSRPPLIEEECVQRGINISKMADSPIFFAHISSKGSTEIIRDANAKGIPAYAETCIHYLVLDDSEFDKPGVEAAKTMVAPPIRDKTHQDALWLAVKRKWLSAVSTDHFAINFQEKLDMAEEDGGDFTTYCCGLPAVEDRCSALWTYGVETGKINKQDFVDLFATSPAKVVGVYPQKGEIAPNADADIVIYDPDYRGIFSIENSQYQGVDYCGFEGLEKKGRPSKVYLRGRLTAEDGKFVGPEKQGKFVEAKPYGMCYDKITF